jgi:hypothetical protein
MVTKDSKHIGCWANSMGDCEGSMTKEHLVSNVILPEKLSVKGFKWCQEEKEIASASFVNKFLCKKHNNQLSVYDVEGGRFYEAVKNVHYKVQSNDTAFFEVRINRRNLEGWLIKTLINLSLTADEDIDINFNSILPFLYRDATLTEPFGLGLASKVGQLLEISKPGSGFKTHVQLQPLFIEDKGKRILVGGLYILYGFTMAVYIPSIELSVLESSSIYTSTVSYENSSLYKDLHRDWSIKEITGQINGVDAIKIWIDP